MKKYLLGLVCLCGLLSTQLFAEIASTQVATDDLEIKEVEQYAFVGITGSYLDPMDQMGVTGFRLGMQNNVWRTMFTYESNWDTYQAFLIEADRTVVAGLLGGKGRIYVGLSGGWIQFSGDTLKDDVTVEFKDYGYTYGGNIGFMFYLSDQIDMSIDYRYLFTQDTCMCGDGNLYGPSLSLHYFF